jgi:anthranilate phosphoribosyltransferase
MRFRWAQQRWWANSKTANDGIRNSPRRFRIGDDVQSWPQGRKRRQSKILLLAALDNHPGAARDIVAFNAGAALYAANISPSIDDGIWLARDVLASGAARAKLDEFVRCTQQLAS